MYSPDEAKTASRNANVVSMGVQYGGGKDDPLLLAIGYEVHNDLFGASRNIPAALSNTANLGARAKDTALRFTAAYNFGKSTSVEFNYATMEYKESGGLAGRFQNYKHGAYSLSLLHRVKSWQFAASMSRANAGTCSLVGGVACTTDGLDGRQVSIGTSYNFSRRASVFVIFSKLTNGYAASYENLDLYRASSGSDISQFAIGMQHRF